MATNFFPLLCLYALLPTTTLAAVLQTRQSGADVDTDAGASGGSGGGSYVSQGGVIAIVVIVVIVVVLGSKASFPIPSLTYSQANKRCSSRLNSPLRPSETSSMGRSSIHQARFKTFDRPWWRSQQQQTRSYGSTVKASGITDGQYAFERRVCEAWSGS